MPTPKVEKSEYYIGKAKEIHGEKYDYSLAHPIYRLHDKTTIICSVHGKFEQAMAGHIYQEQGCPRCGNRFIKTLEEVLGEIKSVHGETYEYPPFEYKNNKQKIKIVCKKHGEFNQGIKEHINGSGCPKCKPNFKKTTETFIEAAKEKHGDKYDYSLVDYKGTDILVDIVCKKHGVFQQTAHAHLAGYGCKRCVANSSKKENEWLESLAIDGLIRQYRLKIGEKTYVVDGFDSKTRTVYQFHGDYFHGNPKFYKPHWVNAVSGKKFGELYSKTNDIREKIKSAGYKYVEKWESNFKSKESRDFGYKEAVYFPHDGDMNHYMNYINMHKYAEGEDFNLGDFYDLIEDIGRKI